MILVGDSLGMVVLGYEDTTQVTLAEMVHHTRAAARGVKRALLVGDLPIHTYDDPAQAVSSARALIEAGAEAVKLEGGASHVPQIEAIIAANIPVMAHIGMLPQSVREEGGYKIKGRTQAEAAALLRDAAGVEKAGVFAVVLEIVSAETARQITSALEIPTIGIVARSTTIGPRFIPFAKISISARSFPFFKASDISSAKSRAKSRS